MLESNQLRKICSPTGRHDQTDHFCNSIRIQTQTKTSVVFCAIHYTIELFARSEGIEPSPLVLETNWLP
jgi:hypothetical protein